MKDKEKQKIVCCETCNHKRVCYDLLTNTDYEFKGYGCLRYCRDLTKDSVVLSREEICELKCQAEEDFNKAYDLGSKEMAEKFLNTIYWKAVKHIKGKNKDECFIEMSFEKLDELAKQFGVEIKE